MASREKKLTVYKNRIKELEEENKKLKKELDSVNITKDNYIKLINKVAELTERIDDTNKWVLDLKNNLNSSLLGHKEYRDYIIDILDEISKRLKGSEE